MAKIYRICKAQHVSAAFDGEGACQFGGRWNSRGIRVVYGAQSLSLATLEMLVHFQDTLLLSGYCFIEAALDDGFIDAVDNLAPLPKNWRDSPPPPEVQKIGDAWAKRGSSVALRVPSAVIPTEFNYVINPDHPDFCKMAYGGPQPLIFDVRLLKAI